MKSSWLKSHFSNILYSSPFSFLQYDELWSCYIWDNICCFLYRESGSWGMWSGSIFCVGYIYGYECFGWCRDPETEFFKLPHEEHIWYFECNIVILKYFMLKYNTNQDTHVKAIYLKLNHILKIWDVSIKHQQITFNGINTRYMKNLWHKSCQSNPNH